MQRHNSIQSFFLRSIPYGVIFLLVLLLFVTNYTPGTWLSGWDNLHPEYNCKLNIVDRSLFSSWQEYQGLGVRAGNAHAADLLHQLGVCTLKTVVPLPLVRYLYHFFALFIGGIGIYLCCKKLFLKNSTPTIQTIAALCGALWYILNLGTMQYFSVPYEAFSHFFASFPWIVLISLLYLQHPSKQHAWLLVIITLLSTPSFYIPTLFVVNTGVLGVISIIYVGQKKRLKPLIFLWTTYIALHAFWLFPFIGFLLKGTAFVGQTMINRMFTEEAFLRNQQFGVFPDVVMLKGFLFNTTDLMVKTNTHDFVLKPWILFLNNPIPYSFHIAVFLFVILGVIISWKQKQKHTLFLTTLLAIGLFAFVSDNPPTGFLFRWLQDHLPLFKQVFRFPFTKFLPIITFAYATTISIALATLLSKPILRTIALAFVVGYLGIANIPAFQGHFIYKEMRVVVPQEYFNLFSFLATQPNGTIATFPQATYWGWTTYDWGYRGSGFPWYGIKQPILDRNFDVWNTYNETYYAALTKALYTTSDPEALLQVFTTYNISYVWIDERIILPSNPDALYTRELKSRLALLPSVSLIFQDNKQSIYRVQQPSNTFVTTQKDSTSSAPFQNTSAITTTVNEDGSITLSTPISPGLLTVPTDTQQQTLGVATWQDNVITIKPYLPILFTDEQPIATTAAAVQTIPIAKNTTLYTINDTIVSHHTPVTVPLEQTNTLKTYTSPTLNLDIATALLAQPIKNCASTATTAAFFGITGQTLIGKASSPCVYAQLSSLAKTRIPKASNSVMQLQITYETTGPTPRICLTKPGDTQCLYQFQEEQTTTGKTTQTTTYTVAPTTIPFSDLWLKIEFDAPIEEEERVTISSLQVSVYTSPTSTKTFSFKETDSASVWIEQPTVLHATFPTTNQATTISMNQSHNEQSCYTLGTNSFNKTLIQEDTTISRYEAKQNSSVCDWIPVPNALTSQGFLFSMQTRNISGRPIKTCLSIHPPHLCLYETIVQANQKNTWVTHTQFIPPNTTQGQWFLELDNYAVGQEIRINDVGPITITPVPYQWLEHISLQRETQNQPDIPSPLLSVEHPYPPLFVVTLRAGYAGPLTLFQSFDSGWHAYTKKSHTIPQKLFEFFPFLFGNDIQDHVLINNWANGWTIPTTKEDTTIVLFFLPQLFEWIGFLLIPIPFLFIINKRV